jgi:hypothetical protein
MNSWTGKLKSQELAWASGERILHAFDPVLTYDPRHMFLVWHQFTFLPVLRTAAELIYMWEHPQLNLCQTWCYIRRAYLSSANLRTHWTFWCSAVSTCCTVSSHSNVFFPWRWGGSSSTHAWMPTYSGRKITEDLGNVIVRGEKRWKK